MDFLKIDGSFVKGVLHDPIDREMVRSINEIGHLTGKQTIVEWAERLRVTAFVDPRGHARRRREATLLYQLVERYAPAFAAMCAAAGRPRDASWAVRCG